MNDTEILALMRPVAGWLSDAEGLLLAALARRTRGLALSTTIVEIGSYVGRSTVCLAAGLGNGGGRIYAIDPHEGHVGDPSPDEAPTLERLRANLAAAGVEDRVEVIVAGSSDVHWDRPIDLLFIDGLHDRDSVAGDFARFAPWVVPGGHVAMHDFTAHFPGVQSVVAEILSCGRYERTDQAGGLIVLRKQAR